MATYVSDMLAVEQHLLGPIRHQAQDDAVAAYPQAQRVIREALDSVTSHISALSTRLDELGGHAGSAVKSGVAQILGSAAVAVSNVRKTEVSKYLRDDYASLSLASASYTLLHTTALAVGDATTASLAQRHLSDVANAIMRISKTLPITVLGELEAEGVNVDRSVVAQAQQDVEAAWTSGAARSEN